MTLTLDIIGGTTFVGSFVLLLRWFWKVRKAWEGWLQSPGASPRAIVDQARRRALSEVFQTYEEERQYVATDSRNAAIDDLEIPENDLPATTGDQELLSLRRRVKTCIRVVEESIGASLPMEAANSSSALGRARYGGAADSLARAHRASWGIRLRRGLGGGATLVGLLGAVTAPAAAVFFSLMAARDVATLAVGDIQISEFGVLVLAWASQVLLLVACVALYELAIRSNRVHTRKTASALVPAAPVAAESMLPQVPANREEP